MIWEEPIVVCTAADFNDMLRKLQKIINELTILKKFTEVTK
ncbi:hypothetical protein LMIV_2068 [Listeria monocytogenes FSL J1-208]|nr:hypothetical protein LMIV_2068 [Listeria monocytogenes FSL J1-208]